MGYLRIIFYGILSFIERNPIFTLFIVILAFVAPFVIRWALWVILGILVAGLIALLLFMWRMRKMQREMNSQFKQSAGAAGFNTNFAGFNTQGMTLEELVRQMQAQADASQKKNTSTQKSNTTKKSSVDSADYVDFEEIK